MDNSFINYLAQQILSNYKERLDELIVVLPNKRAKVFLESSLKKQVNTPVFSPTICSIEELLHTITGMQSVDNIELLFEFYEVYQSCTPKDALQDFEKFSSWAVTLLQDFNEIDRYLLDPNHVLGYLKDIEDIKHWSLDVQNHTPLITNYLAFYDRLSNYYALLYSKLKNQNKGYQGMIYRESIQCLDSYVANLTSPILFAGFNALNAAEEKLFQRLALEQKAEILWDIDATFVNDSFHEAGYFARKIISTWKYYKSHPFERIVKDFQAPKNITIIGTPKTVGQAKIVGAIIDKINPEELSDTAIVLGDENLLEPLLNALPDSVDKVNITMGLPAKNNPIQVFFDKLFKLHLNAQSRGKSYVFYYKELQDILLHPVIALLFDTEAVSTYIKKQNISFIGYERLCNILEESKVEKLFVDVFFRPWNTSATDTLERLFEVVNLLKEQLNLSESNQRLTQVYLYTLYNVFIRLKNYFDTYTQVNDVKLLYQLYKQTIQQAEVSFEGEPLGGLQIMGVLESRTLDFKNIIITSLNEGTLPAGKTTQSFIPYDVKLELGLPTYKEKDAIYTYHFYHMISRAQNIHLFYNTESEGLDAGEKSRFITQLEIEKQENHRVSHEIYAPKIPAKAYTPVVIEKTDTVIERLHEIANSGFSPSALTNYLRNPIQFYYQKVLGLSESDDVEEEIAVNTLGTIIHKSLEKLYTPYLDQFLTISHVAEMKSKVEEVVEEQFKNEFLEGDISNGKNLIAFEVAKRNIQNLLRLEEEAIKGGDSIKVLALEQKLEKTLSHKKLPFDVTIKGEVDRIEERNGTIRIIDYKTGKVEPGKLILEDWGKLISIEHDKVIQILAYAFLYADKVKDQKLEAGIISFKNLANGFMPYAFKVGREKTTEITEETLQFYLNELVELINEILNPAIPFEEELI
ncbi:MAG: PD-(D/E)XK nuclease family protein [Flavobacteriales bacterium]|nr:PD-(D/E)XK nuclease family protein [Flavobacteriales bacterium]